MRFVSLTCDFCDRHFEKLSKDINRALKRKQSNFYCSVSCANKNRELRRDLNCGWCDKPFIGHPARKYCSSSCAAKFNNSCAQHPCSGCTDNAALGRRKFCDPCRDKRKLGNKKAHELESTTLADLRLQYPLNQYHSKIRMWSRAAYKASSRPMSCYLCSYETHVDICHIKDVKDFELSSKVLEVNHIDNLVALCRNHHWEFDHGHLVLTDSLAVQRTVDEN